MSKIYKYDTFTAEVSDFNELLKIVKMKLDKGLPLTPHERAFVEYFYVYLEMED